MTLNAAPEYQPRPTVAVLAALLCLLLAAVVAVQGARLVMLDLEYTRLRTEVGFWGREGYHPEPPVLARTAEALEQLVARAPGQPDYLALQASALAWQAHYSDDYEQTVALGNLALQAQLAAQQLRPAHRHGWSKVLEYASRATMGSTAIEESEARLLLLQAPRG